ncbi:hypothetical protein OP10G_1486 [Fimbriimonas ginsengisoli Gsoil 348]|uniref:Uncharacterized protein n=1 Tax=Fimbriimonas ginsengisoli Gsoil 348 TaxID=661478 RepID=A0A068NT97_FIMGI|nr:hypothetical protein OP10G_1486 [Fimbriimonas ginsengisoli Gsoil 348]
MASASAGAQWSPPPPFETVDLPAINSRTIVTGTILDFKSAGDDWSRREVVVAVKETLKGDASGTATLRLRSFVQDEEFARWKAGGDLMLIAIPPTEGEPASLIDLSSKDLAVFTADLKLLRTPDDVIRTVKERVRVAGNTAKVERYVRNVPVSRIAGTPLEKGAYVSPDKTVRFYVPVDQRLEQYGQGLLRSKEMDHRIEGIRILGHFKTDANISRLKERLRDDGWIPTWSYEGNKLLAFRVNEVRRTAYETLKSLGISVPKPLTDDPPDRDHQVVSADLGGAEVRHDLVELARCPNLVDLSLATAKLEPPDIEALAQVKALKMIYLQGSNIADDGLRHLAALPRLAYINLGGTPVTDIGVRELARFRSLKKVDLGANATAAGVEALHRLRPDIQIQPDDFAFLARLHPQRVELGFRGRSVPEDHSVSREIWRYALVFPKETAGQVDALLRQELLRRGWKAGHPEAQPQYDGYYRERPRLPGSPNLVHLDNVILTHPPEGEVDRAWGVSAEPGGRLIIVERVVAEKPRKP